MTPPRHRRGVAAAVAALTGAALAAAAVPPLPATAAVAADDTLIVTGPTSYLIPAGGDGGQSSPGVSGLGYSAFAGGRTYAVREDDNDTDPAGLYVFESDGDTTLVTKARGLAGLTAVGSDLVVAQNYCTGADGQTSRARLVRIDPTAGTRSVVAKDLPGLSGLARDGKGFVGISPANDYCNPGTTESLLLSIGADGSTSVLWRDRLGYPTDVERDADGSYLVTASGYVDEANDTEDMDAGALLRVPDGGGESEVVARVSFPLGLDRAPDGTVYTAGYSFNGNYEVPPSGIVQALAPGASEATTVTTTSGPLFDVVVLGEPAEVVDPRITAKRTSAKPRNAAGWYRTPVTVTFTCTEGSAPLAEDCPAPVRLSNADRSLEESISATDGGTDSVGVRVQVDTIAPELETRLVGEAPYSASAEPVRFTASDALSGVAVRWVVKYNPVRTRDDGSRFRTWVVKARDVAGNLATKKGSFAVRR